MPTGVSAFRVAVTHQNFNHLGHEERLHSVVGGLLTGKAVERVHPDQAGSIALIAIVPRPGLGLDLKRHPVRGPEPVVEAEPTLQNRKILLAGRQQIVGSTLYILKEMWVPGE